VNEALRGTLAEVEKELLSLQELLDELAVVKTQTDVIAKRAKGSILHDFYNCCERIFKKIAVEMNSGYEESEKWHKGLLYRMTIPVEGIRPRVISDELAADLDEFLAFRHLFRNIYGYELKGGRIDFLAGKLEQVAGRFKKEVREFVAILKQELD
jgi:HepT-like protein